MSLGEKRHGLAWPKKGMGTRQSKVEGLDMWKLSNLCMQGKTVVKLMKMMMMSRREHHHHHSTLLAFSVACDEGTFTARCPLSHQPIFWKEVFLYWHHYRFKVIPRTVSDLLGLANSVLWTDFDNPSVPWNYNFSNCITFSISVNSK